MRIFGIGGDKHGDRDATRGSAPTKGSGSGSGSGSGGAGGSDASGQFATRLLDLGIAGKGRFAGAAAVADAAVAKHGPGDKAVTAIVRRHVGLAAVGGFATGLGGFVTMPIALPANALSFYVVATRMVASIAAVRGYDVHKPEVRSAVLLTLVGADGKDVMNKAGLRPAGRLTGLATDHLPAPVLMAVNKGIGFRLMRQTGTGMFSWLGKGVPLMGGVIGAVLDGYKVYGIGGAARQQLETVGSPLSSGSVPG